LPTFKRLATLFLIVIARRMDKHQAQKNFMRRGNLIIGRIISSLWETNT